jgi:hypothetical protein
MRLEKIVPQYVERFPANLEEGVLYISETFSQAAHLCCCGCKSKIVTSLKPAKWRLTKHPGGSVSLCPSIGNSNGACKSHYVIERNQIDWYRAMTPALTELARRRDQADLQRAYGKPRETPEALETSWLARVLESIRKFFS